MTDSFHRSLDAALHRLAARIEDGMGREWARHSDGSWRALGHALTAESPEDIADNYGPAEPAA
jgi:hypothetical protein